MHHTSFYKEVFSFFVMFATVYTVKYLLRDLNLIKGYFWAGPGTCPIVVSCWPNSPEGERTSLAWREENSDRIQNEGLQSFLDLFEIDQEALLGHSHEQA